MPDDSPLPEMIRVHRKAASRKVVFSDPSAAPTFVSDVEMIMSRGGVTILHFYAFAEGPPNRTDPNVDAEPIPTRCLARVVLPPGRLATIAAMFASHVQQKQETEEDAGSTKGA